MLSDHDIQSAQVSVEPPLWKKRAKRQVFLIAHRGAILKGITLTQSKGTLTIDVPNSLYIVNRPEHGLADVETMPELGYIEQPLSDMARETLQHRVREHLRLELSRIRRQR